MGIGCWSYGGGDYWGDQAQSDVDAVANTALDAGIVFFDTAVGYNEGRSEQSLGIALKHHVAAFMHHLGIRGQNRAITLEFHEQSTTNVMISTT